MTKVYDRNGRRIIAALWDEISQIPDRVNEIAVLTDPNKLQYVGWNDVANELQLLDFDAVDIPYDNSGSGLVATNVQDAIDEIAAASGLSTVFAGYCDAFTAAEQLPAGWTAARVGGGLITVTHSLGLSTNKDLSITAIALSNGSNDSRIQLSTIGVNSFQIQSYNTSTGGAADVDVFFIATRNA